VTVGKKKYIEMFGSFTEPFNCHQFIQYSELHTTVNFHSVKLLFDKVLQF